MNEGRGCFRDFRLILRLASLILFIFETAGLHATAGLHYCCRKVRRLVDFAVSHCFIQGVLLLVTTESKTRYSALGYPLTQTAYTLTGKEMRAFNHLCCCF
jgi:hypothetical protein